MDTVELYTFENAEGTPDTFTTFNAHEAEERAKRYNLRVVAQSYEYADSETVWDFTDGGEDDEPTECECDNTHAANGTVCRYCWAQGKRADVATA